MSIHRLLGLDAAPPTAVARVELASSSGVPERQAATNHGDKPSYWSMLARGPSEVVHDARPVGARTSLMELPKRIQVAPANSMGSALTSTVKSDRRYNIPLSHSIGEDNHEVLKDALQALTTYETSAASLALLNKAPIKRGLLVTASDILNRHGVIGALTNRIVNDPKSDLVLVLDHGLLRRRDKSELLAAMHEQLLQAGVLLGAEPPGQALGVGREVIAFERELALNRRQDQFLGELGIEGDLEATYAYEIRSLMIYAGKWEAGKQQVLQKLSPHLRARFTELGIKGQNVNLGEAIDTMEVYRSEDGDALSAKQTLDMNTWINGIRSLVKEKIISMDDVRNELVRRHHMSQAGREAVKLDVMFGLLADEADSERSKRHRVEDETY